VLLEYWHPSTLVVRLIAGARTLATASVVVTAAVGIFGGGGLGQIILQYMQLLRWNQAFTGWLILVVLALLPDVLFGILQFACSFIPGKAQPAAE
jgi:ABC-type proline/glycine betaine transport system permease subunit